MIVFDQVSLLREKNNVYVYIYNTLTYTNLIHDQIFCTATSVITVHSPDCVEMVNSGKVGLGQLFRFLDKLPTFTILDAGTTDSGGLWRKYRLECTELTCDILEEFVPNAWELKNGIMIQST